MKDFDSSSVDSYEKLVNKEGLSKDKQKSIHSLFLGDRAAHFDLFLKKFPTSGELTEIIEKLDKPDIDNVIFDLDGTLVSPYSDIPDSVLDTLKEYVLEGRRVFIYTNSPHTERLDVFNDIGVEIAKTGIPKPSIEGFKILCEKYNIDPAKTAMVGNSPITDMPLVKEKENPFLALNILVESIPPDKKCIKSVMKYTRAELFHSICVSTAVVVKIKNPKIFEL